MSDNRTIVSVSFSHLNPYEDELYEFAKKQDKFLGPYIKRLIERDKREKEQGFINIKAPQVQVTQKTQDDEDSDAASGFL